MYILCIYTEEMMSTTLQKWGNSLGIRVPKAIADQLNLTSGTEVEFGTNGDVLTIRPKRPRRKYKLSELLKQMKPRHRHGELFRDGPVGRELI
jgi:antitoxin MazE